jgi:WD40 repeat protein
MRVYEGAGDIIWSVVRCGPRFDQIAAFSEKVVCIWNHTSGVPEQILPAEHEAHRDARLVVFPNGRWLIAYAHRTMRCWECKRDQWELQWQIDGDNLFLARFDNNTSDVLQIDFQEIEKDVPGVILSRRSLDSKSQVKKTFSKVATSENSFVSPEWLYKVHYYASDISADGRWFFYSPHLWSLTDTCCVGVVKPKRGHNEAAFSPDGSFLAVDGGTTVYVYRTEKLELVTTWRVKHTYSPRLAWSLDGRVLARADASTTVRVFDVNAQTEVVSRTAKRQRATALSFSPDGLTLLVGTFGGNVVVWDMD